MTKIIAVRAGADGGADGVAEHAGSLIESLDEYWGSMVLISIARLDLGV